MAVVGTILLFPFRIIGWIFKHPRYLIILIALVGAVFFFRTCSKTFGGTTNTTITKVPSYLSIEPTIDQAPYVVETGTRIYYVKKYIDNGQILTMQQYYTYDKDTWQFSNKSLALNRNVYGLITLTKRS